MITLGGETDERIRLGQLVGGSSTDGYLLRTMSRLFPGASERGSWRAGVVEPEARVVRNSGIPFSLNEGSLWAGRGWNGEATTGGFLFAGPVRLIVAPTFVAEENRAFQVIPYPQNATPARSVWANPFHPMPESIDLPLRLGDRSRARVDAGQSSLTVDAPLVSLGVGTENLWWGPGIRNAITLSNNAPGFPHAFVQLRPLHTSGGTLDGQWILGSLRESDFFDGDSTNDTRSLAGLAVTWAPPNSGLTFGGARLVMSVRSNNQVPASAAFDVLRRAGQPDDTTRAAGRRDQISSLFARWVFPHPGFEAYAEWARFEEPRSFRDFLEYPGHSQGYTLGFQWADSLARARAFRLQSEVSYLEPDASIRVRPVAVTYTSRSVPQGFTERGRTLGAAIGPGASSQWLAGDIFAPRWRLGAYLSRIRWDNGTLFEPIVPQYKRQDVTLAAGLRGSASWRGVRALVDYAHAARFNYLYQSYILGPSRFGGIDLINNTFSVTLTTTVPRL